MLFNSFTFWIFFAIVLALYWSVSFRKQNLVLLAASYVFYGFWSLSFLGLMIFSTTIDYFAAIAIEDNVERSRRKLFLCVSICSNLTILAVFKYSGFFIREMNHLLASFGVTSALPVLGIVLPVGISFYTFQSIAYTVDVYRKEVQATRNYLDYALFVAFFPQLVAGPIQRASSLLPQLLNPRVRRASDFREGLFLIVSGLVRKVVIADNLAPVANAIFGGNGEFVDGERVPGGHLCICVPDLL
jgi:alginate O-acetyltransferase complex protein AlgI